MLDITQFKHKYYTPLIYDAECYLLAVDSTGNIYAEEYYDESYIAQHRINSGCQVEQTVDENHGKRDIIPLLIPDDAILPRHPVEHPLNFTGVRFRGLRAEEKVAEWTQAIPMMEKIPLLQSLNINVPPIMIFGIVESRVLSETEFSGSETILCRRIRLLRALPEIQLDVDGLPYDYDTITFHVLHSYDHEADSHPPLHEAIQHFSQLSRPTDCIHRNGDLIVANSSDSTHPASVHIFQLQENNQQE